MCLFSPIETGFSRFKKHLFGQTPKLKKLLYILRVRSVKGRGNTLQSECARLESEKKNISEFAQVMKGKLENFDELESITKKFQVGLSKVRLLHCLDLRATPTSFKILTFYLRNKICVYFY